MSSSSEVVLSQEWYVWTVKSGKFEIVKTYIENNIPEVRRVLYPTITTEKRTVKGEVKKNKSPLYAGYMFLQYTHDSDNPQTWVKLNKHPFVTGYVGPCTAKDLASVDSLQKVEKINNEKVKNFCMGDVVRVTGGVFVNYTGLVDNIASNSISVLLQNDGKSLKVVFTPEDLDVLERKDGH